MHEGKIKQKFKCSTVYFDNCISGEKENKITGKIDFDENYSGSN